MTTLTVIIMALLGGAIYRWRGGLTNSDGTQALTAPRFVRLLLWAYPIGLLTQMTMGWSFRAVVFLWMLVGASLGHAKWQDLGHMNLRPKDWYWHDVGGLAWSGLLMAGPVGMIAKPAGYMIGWYGFDRQWTYPTCPWLRWGTEVGEFLTGFFIYGGLTALILWIT